MPFSHQCLNLFLLALALWACTSEQPPPRERSGANLDDETEELSGEETEDSDDDGGDDDDRDDDGGDDDGRDDGGTDDENGDDSLSEGGPTFSPTGGSGGAKERAQYQFSANGLETEYWLEAPSDNDKDNPSGLLIFFHGDGNTQNPPSKFYKQQFDNGSKGGGTGVKGLGIASNMLEVAVRAPNDLSWWKSGSDHARLLHDLIQKIGKKYNIDPTKLALVGYSGGAHFITQHFLQRYGDLYKGQAILIAGGAPPSGDVINVEKARKYWKLHFRTAPDDHLFDNAQDGSKFYDDEGFDVETDFSSGPKSHLDYDHKAIVTKVLGN